ncbi:MAG TPA: N-acetylmuramoyl-L-alanine amidase-like domain-containing protein [Gemmatimonadaceae bacterium]|nr:N-acetylmuramoyl-L-alanine amidase-like domain-containing protein [Gemmatimonadaceae bacterium]
MNTPLSRRELLRNVAVSAAGLMIPFSLFDDDLARISEWLEDTESLALSDSDQARLAAWTTTLRREAPAPRRLSLGRRAIRVGELAVGTPYEAFTLEAYLRAGGNPSRTEPLTVSLSRFDCVTLVESCLAVARVAAQTRDPSWDRFAREVERMRYRGGKRGGYTSRLHYFSEWISDGEKRGLVRDLGAELGGIEDTRPLRFMTGHRSSYPALANDAVFRAIGEMERSLDKHPRHVVPTARIPEVVDRIQTGDVVAFATSIPGLDVSHAAFAYRDSGGVLRVLHAPLSGGVVEVTRSTLPEYVSAIRRATGILVARPLG